MVKKKLLIILAFLVCGHFMIATKNASAMGDFSGYLINTYYNPQWDFTTRTDCQNYNPSYISNRGYTNTSGAQKQATCFYVRRANGANISVQEGQIIVVQLSTSEGGYIENYFSAYVNGGLVSSYNFMNVIGYDSSSFYAGSNYTIYLYTDKTYNGVIKFPLGLDMDPGASLSINSISIYVPNGEMLNAIDNKVYDIRDLLQQMSQDSAGSQMEQDKQEQQEQGQASQDTEEQTESSVEGSTQNLLSVIGNFFGAFTNARPSNCNFNWGLADYGFGTINMCQTQIPSEFRTIFSILSIIIIIPMIMWLISSIINAFKEFQQ